MDFASLHGGGGGGGGGGPSSAADSSITFGAYNHGGKNSGVLLAVVATVAVLGWVLFFLRK